jgi:preprotein translocase subunit SecE
VNDLVKILIWVAVIGGVFALLWWQGQLVRIRNYVLETREELKKCTWPTWDELKGSTALVVVSIILLGGFTVITDLFFNMLVRLVT